ncbi:MAG: YihD family protein [Psychromonas sp.]
MQSHRINEVLELLKPYWLKNQELSLLEVLALLSKESGFEKSLANLSDEVIIYHLKMDQTEKGEMIPGIKKDCEDDFQSALLKARGIT